jgi:hypothetical protein
MVAEQRVLLCQFGHRGGVAEQTSRVSGLWIYFAALEYVKIYRIYCV